MTGGRRTGSTLSRLSAILLAIGLVALGWMLLVAPALSARATLEEELRTAQMMRVRFRAAAVPRRDGDAAVAILRASTTALAAAQLQTRIDGVIGDAGAVTDQLESLALPISRGASGLEPVGVTASFTATIAQLRRILLAIQTDRLAMIVDELSVQGEAPGATPTSSNEAGRLRIEMRVRSFRTRAGSR